MVAEDEGGVSLRCSSVLAGTLSLDLELSVERLLLESEVELELELEVEVGAELAGRCDCCTAIAWRRGRVDEDAEVVAGGEGFTVGGLVVVSGGSVFVGSSADVCFCSCCFCWMVREVKVEENDDVVMLSVEDSAGVGVRAAPAFIVAVEGPESVLGFSLESEGSD